MARIHEYQGKKLLEEAGFEIPYGAVASTPQEALKITQDLINDGHAPHGVVLKIQAWTTGRKAVGGVAFADTPQQAESIAKKLLAIKVGNFPVEQILVEEKLPIKDELFVSLFIDDAARAPVMLLALVGGSGIESRADLVHRLPIDVKTGLDQNQLNSIITDSPLKPELHKPVRNTVNAVFETARKYEARSVEINPLVTTTDDRIVAADCRITIDDYAVFRHPELNIEIARELDHPPTPLERIAYEIEQQDHRGTFYFAKLPIDPHKPIVGFHGAGGGGSMMSMDAITEAGFSIANFTDTSGNPSSAKVYRAARIILAQPDLVGYFGSGSGVASQEQFNSAYGLAKAFLELNLAIPAVIRLGGNAEDRAVEILQDACKDLPAKVQAYKKDDTPAFCAERFKQLVDALLSNQSQKPPGLHKRTIPSFVGSPDAYSFPITGGTVWINYPKCDEQTSTFIIEHAADIFKPNNETGKPELAIPENEVEDKDSELIACEIECIRNNSPALFVNLPIPDLDF